MFDGFHQVLFLQIVNAGLSHHKPLGVVCDLTGLNDFFFSTQIKKMTVFCLIFASIILRGKGDVLLPAQMTQLSYN